MKNRGNGPLFWIIALKALKCAALVATGAILLVTRRMIPADELLARVAHYLHVPLTSHLLQRLTSIATSLTPRREVIVACTSFAFVRLFGTEAVGLSMRAPWARWLTIAATACFIPVNLGVVWYLVRRKDMFEG
jgi:uncharacterized membrane protein (DUF2068 family)